MSEQTEEQAASVDVEAIQQELDRLTVRVSALNRKKVECELEEASIKMTLHDLGFHHAIYGLEHGLDTAYRMLDDAARRQCRAVDAGDTDDVLDLDVWDDGDELIIDDDMFEVVEMPADPSQPVPGEDQGVTR